MEEAQKRLRQFDYFKPMNRTIYNLHFYFFSVFLLLIGLAPVHANEALNIYTFTMQDIDGKEVSLADFKGRPLLIVNTASKCGYTPQYKSLESLYQKYQEQGLVVLGFPANNFKGQEPGTNEEIKNFCFLNYKVTFPMFAKISVTGDDIHPLYKYLTGDPQFGGPITWNFNKFFIDKEGKIVARFPSDVDPLAPEVVSQVETLLRTSGDARPASK